MHWNLTNGSNLLGKMISKKTNVSRAKHENYFSARFSGMVRSHGLAASPCPGENKQDKYRTRNFQY